MLTSKIFYREVLVKGIVGYIENVVGRNHNTFYLLIETHTQTKGESLSIASMMSEVSRQSEFHMALHSSIIPSIRFTFAKV
jgi:hypothetical protein